jgi:DNA-binding transcriptional LysR family regulator
MDIRVIHYFISVYEEKSFTKAAERMHVVPSALSMQIRNLEDELGTAVFERTKRGVEATVAGRRFYELCLPIARTVATVKQEIRDLVQGNNVSGSLRVGLPSSLCQGILGGLLEEFYSRYPNVDITIVEAYSRYVTEQVQSGFLDVALGAMPIEHTSLACRPSFKDQFVLISGKPINGEQFTPCDLSKSKDLKLVVPSERHLMGSTLLDYIAGGQILAKRVAKIDGLVATMESVRNSDWGAVCQAVGVFNELISRKLFIYPIVKPTMQFDLYMLHSPRRPLTLAARCFVEMLEKKIEEVLTVYADVFRDAWYPTERRTKENNQDT